MRPYVMLLNSAKFYDIQHPSLTIHSFMQITFWAVPPVNAPTNCFQGEGVHWLLQLLMHSATAESPNLILLLETFLSLETFLLSENKFITFCKPNPLDVILYNTYIKFSKTYFDCFESIKIYYAYKMIKFVLFMASINLL